MLDVKRQSEHLLQSRLLWQSLAMPDKPKSRSEDKGVRIPKELKGRVKSCGALRNLTLKATIIEALEEYLSRRNFEMPIDRGGRDLGTQPEEDARANKRRK